MTIAGFTITAPDRAFVWADTEVFAEDGTITRRDKIATDVCNRMAAVGTGWRGVTLAAFDAFRRCDHVDDAVRQLPGVMRQAAARVADRQADRAGFLTCALGLVGWSPSARRVCAWRLDADRLFSPEPTRNAVWTGDVLAELEQLHPAEPSDLLAVISGQLAALQRHHPNIAGDAVHVATVAAEGVAVRAFRLPPLAVMQPKAAASEAPSAALISITDSVPGCLAAAAAGGGRPFVGKRAAAQPASVTAIV